jgi:hypothetical protein
MDLHEFQQQRGSKRRPNQQNQKPTGAKNGALVSSISHGNIVTSHPLLGQQHSENDEEAVEVDDDDFLNTHIHTNTSASTSSLPPWMEEDY